MASSQDELLRRAHGGDRDALAELLKMCGPTLRPALTGKIPSRWQSLLSVDDVMQQAYTDAFLDIHDFEATVTESFLAWLTKLATNNLLDAIRALEAEKRGGKRRRIDVQPGQDSFQALHEHLVGATTSTTPSRKAMRAEADDALRCALRRLPEIYRQVVQLHDLEGRPIDEVAATIARSVGASYLLRIRAHRRLRELLAGKTTILRDSS